MNYIHASLLYVDIASQGTWSLLEELEDPDLKGLASRLPATILHSRADSTVKKYLRAYLTIFGKIDHLRASNEIHFLPVQKRYIHALSRNTNCLTIDGQVCFYRRLFTDAVKPQGCISWSWGALIGLHGVPNCSSWQSWPPPLWIVSVLVTY